MRNIFSDFARFRSNDRNGACVRIDASKIYTYSYLKSFAIKLMLVVGMVCGITIITFGQTIDELTNSLIGVSGTSYSSWSGKTSNSDAVYAGNSAGGNNAIQLRSSNSNSGIVTTTSGGSVTKIKVTWNNNTTSGRTLDIYGKTTAYSAPTDLYNSSTQGTKIGSIVYGTSTELTISGSYTYIGLRSNSGAMYLNRIEITWATVAPISYSITAESNNTTLGTVSLSGPTITAFPQECVGYANSAYTVTSGTATVSQSGDVFTVTPSSNCTVRINFAEKPTYNVNWIVGGSTISTRSYCQGSTIPAGDVPIPTSGDCNGKTFVGWSTTEVAETDDEPTLVTAAEATVNGEMNFYAVFAEASGSGHNEYCLYSGALTEGDYVIYYSGKAMNTTVSSDRLQYEEVTPISNTITTTDASIVWHIAPSGNYWTIYNAAAGKYAASTGVKNKAQMLDDGTDDKSLWSNSGTSTYEFVNKKNSASGINSNLRNNGTFGFACYASGTGGALSLYKRTISYSAYSTSCVPCEADPAISSTALNFSDITSSSVTVEAPGGITSFGENCHIRSYGFVYGTSANPTLTSGTVAVAGTSYTTINSSFNKVIDGLSPCTIYHVRAYATNGHGTVYGSDCTFTTGSDAEIIGLISVNGETSATLYWNLIGEPCVSGHYVVICRQGSSDIASSCSNFTSITANEAFGSGTQTSTGEYAVYSGSETSAAISNLTSGSTYTAAVFYVDDSGNCLLREQITFVYTLNSAAL